MDIIDSKDENFEERIIEIYNNDYIGKHLSLQKIADIYGHDSTYYCNYFRKYGLKTRDNIEKTLKYTVDSNYFEYIDTEEKAYWLGFIYADGFITCAKNGNNRKLGISLINSDKNHLYKFREAINGTMPIHTYNVTSGYNTDSIYCRIIVSNQKIINDLMKHGVYEHKSNIIDPPILNEKFEKYFIRGYFDGNGSISITTTTKTPSYKIRFVSTNQLLDYVQNILLKENIINRTYKYYKRRPEHIVSQLDFGGNNQSYKFLNWIYSEAKIYLDRKYERYIKLIDIVNSKK